MTLQQLRYIIAIDEYRHFGKAAEACGLTQSTLSLMVKKMEEELDVRIFDRDAHPVVPTEIGRKIIDRAKVVLYQVEQITEMTRTEKETLSGPLHIALISTVAPVLIPGIFKFIGFRYPSISLQTEEMLTSTIKDKLRKWTWAFWRVPLRIRMSWRFRSITNASWPMCHRTIPLIRWKASGRKRSSSNLSGSFATV